MPSKMTLDPTTPTQFPPRPDGWPMVESALRPTEPQQPRLPFSEFDEQARELAEAVEARTRGNDGGPPSLDRLTARALVEAGYMPLADYIALYGHEVAADAERQARSQRSGQITGHFSVAFARRQQYRPASVHCTFTKPAARPTRPKRRGSR